MNTNGQLVETLAGSELYQNFERSYTETTGLPVALRPVETWRLPLHGKRRESPFCALMAQTSRACAACLQTQGRLAEAAREQPCTMNCAYGLAEVAVPVKVGAKTVGLLQTGQVMHAKPTVRSFHRVVQRAQALGVELDNPQARQAYLATPVGSRRQLKAAAGLLSIFADHLSMKSNQILVRASSSEPPVITRARAYIREHHAEDLSLGQVAAAVHTSVFYFCKIFHKATGLTFTEFVSRVRIDRAKHLLLYPHRRVSEVAYAVGFQSLTHFNRVFKSVVGESPTEYRRRLPRVEGEARA